MTVVSIAPMMVATSVAIIAVVVSGIDDGGRPWVKANRVEADGRIVQERVDPAARGPGQMDDLAGDRVARDPKAQRGPIGNPGKRRGESRQFRFLAAGPGGLDVGQLRLDFVGKRGLISHA